MKKYLFPFRLLLFAVLVTGCIKEPILPPPPPELSLFGGETQQSALDMIEDADGGLWLLGGESIAGENEHDILLVHSDAEGQELNRYSFDEGEDEVGQKLIRTSDGGFLIGGVQGQSTRNYFLLKLDAQLNREWFRIYPPSIGQFAWVSNVLMIGENASGYLIAARITSDLLEISNVNQEGLQLNFVHITGNFLGAPYSCATRTLDGGYAFLGYSFNNQMLNLVTCDSLGNLVSALFLDPGINLAGVQALCQLPGGHYFFKAQNFGTEDAWFSISPPPYVISWSTGPDDDYISSIVPGTNGHFFVTGFSENPEYYSEDKTMDVFVAEWDSGGNELRRYILDGPRQDWISRAILLSDGTLACAGHSDSFEEEHTRIMLLKPWQ